MKEKKHLKKPEAPIVSLTRQYNRRFRFVDKAIDNSLARYKDPLSGSDSAIAEDARRLSNIHFSVLKLKEIRPDCESLKGDYERKFKEYLKLVKPQTRGLEAIQARISKQNERAWHLQRQLDWCAQQLPEMQTWDDYMNLVYDDGEGTESWSQVPREQISRMKSRIENGLSLANSISLKYARLAHDVEEVLGESRALEARSHNLIVVTESKSYPSNRPGELRMEDKIVGRNCTKCGIQVSRWDTI